MENHNDSWEEFTNIVNKNRDKGYNRIIPIIGSGFNIQAFRENYDWERLLKKVAKEFKLVYKFENTNNELYLGLTEIWEWFDLQVKQSELYKNKKTIEIENILKNAVSKYKYLTNESYSSMTAIWEWFVVQLKESELYKNKETSQIEYDLKKVVVDFLKEDIEKISNNNSFMRDFLNLGFRDIISINFDRSLALQNDSKEKVIVSPNDKYFKSDSSLFRHAVIKNSYQTRIWYAHGDTEDIRTIKLGVRSYGTYIKSLNSVFHKYRNFIKAKRSESINKGIFYLKFCDEVRELPHNKLNWLWLGMSSPIVFLGCGLSSDEWPLWWFLIQRSRHLAHYKKSGKENPAYILLQEDNKPQVKWLLNNPAGLLPLKCNRWDEGWDRLLNIIGLNVKSV